MITEQDKVFLELQESFDDYMHFLSLVSEMRAAQKNYYKEKPILGVEVAYKNMLNKEYKVDKWLEENI